MAPIQEPEIQFAQRLASNEKPMRTKAIKKLRKYISVRSQKIKGGFEGDELLKLWKGLFYCLWMQDKPLLQEELSNQISGLLHNFQNVQSQFLFLETFLQTIKREWTGIDRLRMDKFFQLVRFVFKNTFEMMKRKEWETSVVTRFLELLTAQVLHSSSGAPCGLQFHILDIYMTELAAVGSAELTAAQNLTFIDPFCKTASKTRDRILLKAICSSIFSAIVDQAPFAIEDLLKEVKATGGGAEESDSGQASEEEDVKKELPKDKKAAKKTNGIVSTEEDEDGLEDEDDDEMLHMESDSESEMPEDTEMGPVLQFDYSALADRLFGLASRSNTPSHNRQRLYKVIKTLRDLSEGVFPQDEYPEEVSTDEDDDEMFGSRKRMKRGRGFGDEEEEGSPAKKQKGKKNNSKAGKSDQTAATDDSKPVEIPGDANKKKKKKKRKKTGAVKSEEQNGVEEGSEVKAEADTTPASAPQTTDAKEAETEPSIPAKGTDTRKAFPGEKAEITAMETGVQSGTPQDVVVGNLSSVTVIEVDQKNQSEKPVPDATSSKKKKKIKKSKTPAPEEEGYVAGPETNTDVVGPSVDTTKAGGRPAPATQDGEAAEGSSESALETATTTTTTSRRKISKQAAEEQTTIEEVEITSEIVDKATPPKTRRRRKTKRTAETDATPLDVVIPEDAEVAPASVAIPTPLKKKKKKAAKAEEQTVEAKGETQLEADANLAEVVEVATPTPLKKKKKSGRVADEQEPDTMAEEQPTDAGLDTPVKNGKKKRKIPVVIEVESEVNGVAGNKKAKLGNDSEEPTTPVSAKKTKRMTPRKAKAGAESDFITFQTHATIPTPLFFKTAKGSPSTPLSSKKKKCRTPKSESKKVTFGLNKNKTAEFRKTDRSLLVSPEGSSRVPFDPQQKPLFGVLKSPEASLTNSTKKTKGTPKRPTAADFF